jgi:hypothetical protein
MFLLLYADSPPYSKRASKAESQSNKNKMLKFVSVASPILIQQSRALEATAYEKAV